MASAETGDASNSQDSGSGAGDTGSVGDGNTVESGADAEASPDAEGGDPDETPANDSQEVDDAVDPDGEPTDDGSANDGAEPGDEESEPEPSEEPVDDTSSDTPVDDTSSDTPVDDTSSDTPVDDQEPSAPDQDPGASAPPTPSTELSEPEPEATESSALPESESAETTGDSADPVTTQTLSGSAGSSDGGAAAPEAVDEVDPDAAAIIAIVKELMKLVGGPAAGSDGSSPLTGFDTLLQGMWLAGRQNAETRAAHRAAVTAAIELVNEAALAELGKSVGWIPVVGTVTYAVSFVGNLGALGAALLSGDQDDIADELRDLGRDLVGMIPVVGAPIAGTLYDQQAGPGTSARMSALAAAEPALATATMATATLATAAAAAPVGSPQHFLSVLQRAISRLAGWPGTPRNFVDITNYLTDQTLDNANNQLDGLYAGAPVGSQARWLPDLVSIVSLFFIPSVPGAAFTDKLNAMGDFLNRVVPPFVMADGAGTLDVISPYKIMGAAVVGAATLLRDMLNGIYDPVQWEINIIKTTTGATVVESDLNDFNALMAKITAAQAGAPLGGDGGAFYEPTRAWDVTLPTWTEAQVNPYTLTVYVALVGIYKRFQEMAVLTQFTTSTTYESWHYTNSLGMYAAGSFHAVDPDGNPVDFFGVSQGGTYTSAGNALVTINTADGGYTYTPPAVWDPKFQDAAFFHRSTSENEADRYDTVQIPVKSFDGVEYTLTFRIEIIDGTNADPTGSSSVINTDAAGVVKGNVNGSDSDGDTLTYTLVDSSVNGLSGNSAYTKNGSGNGGIVTINPTTGEFTYVSSATAGATQSFQVRIGDGHYGSAIVTVTVPNTTTITPANVDTSTQNVVTGTVPSSTNKPGAFTGYALGSSPTKGVVTSFDPATGAFTYARNSGLGHSTTPDDIVTVIATDADGRQVTLQMNVVPTVSNAAPVVVSTTTDKGSADTNKWRLDNAGGDNRTQTTTGKITATDADGDTITYSLVNPSTYAPVTTTTDGGTVTFNADGSFTYTITKDKSYFHAAAKIGASAADVNDTFTVAVNDGFGGVTYTTVTMATYAVNSAPLISGFGGLTCAFWTCTVGAMTVSDPDGDSIPNSSVTPGTGAGYTLATGSVTVWGSGTTTISWGAGGTLGTTPTANTFTVYDGYYTVTNGVVNAGSPAKFWAQWADGSGTRTTGN